MLTALCIDALFGWPKPLFKRLSHPVVWIGALIDTCEAHLNHGSPMRRRFMGGVTFLLVVTTLFVPSLFIQLMLAPSYWAIMLGGVLAWPFVAYQSLYTHVLAVIHPLSRGDIVAARASVSMIVGRDADQLNQAGVARAALESLGENSSDGVIAPLFWGVVAGLPGIVVYKAINTMDSMIGHRSERYEDFGKIAARADDVANLIPARLSGVLWAIVSAHPHQTIKIMRAEAGHHRSPNAGWPEAALAGALNIRLSGPRAYGDKMSNEEWINPSAPDPDVASIKQGLALYKRMIAVFALGAGVILGVGLLFL